MLDSKVTFGIIEACVLHDKRAQHARYAPRPLQEARQALMADCQASDPLCRRDGISPADSDPQTMQPSPFGRNLLCNLLLHGRKIGTHFMRWSTDGHTVLGSLESSRGSGGGFRMPVSWSHGG